MDWATCPSCQLKHRARPDGSCPRCRTSLSGAPAEAFVSPALPAPVPDAAVATALPMPAPVAEERTAFLGEDAPLHAGIRWGGLFLVLNALLAGGVTLFLPVESGAIGGITPAVIDLILGGMLLWGNRRFLALMLVRIALGGLVFIGLALFQGEFLQAVFQLAFSGGLLLLLWGLPDSRRISIGAISAGLCLGLQVVELVVVGSLASIGVAPNYDVAPTEAAAADEGDPETERLEDAPSTISGYQAVVTMDRPARYWKVRPQRFAQARSPRTEIALVEPRALAELRILRYPAAGTTVEEVGDHVRQDLFAHFSSWDGQRARPLISLPAEIGTRAFGAIAGRPSSGDYRVHVELHAVNEAVWAIVFFAPVSAYDEYAPDVEEALATLRVD